MESIDWKPLYTLKCNCKIEVDPMLISFEIVRDSSFCSTTFVIALTFSEDITHGDRPILSSSSKVNFHVNSRNPLLTVDYERELALEDIFRMLGLV